MKYGKKETLNKQKTLTSKSHLLQHKIGVISFKIILFCILALFVIGCCALFGILHGIIQESPDISKINVAPSGYSTSICDSNGVEIQKLSTSESNRIYATIDEIPLHMQKAFIAIEDARFLEHNGIDVQGIFRAAYIGLKNNFRFTEGASTITQQLLKNNVFEGWVTETSFSAKAKRKIQEQYLALQLEKRMSKDTILEYYLNTINLGAGTLGVRSAAYRYFNKDVSDLTLSEATVIAGITKNPTGLNPIRFPEENAKRRETILTRMVEQGAISEEEKEEALADNVYDRIQVVSEETEDSSPYTYFVDETTKQVLADLKGKLGYSDTQAHQALYSSGLTIITTQDTSIQKICDEEYLNEDNFPGCQYELSYALTIQGADEKHINFSTENLKSYYQEQDSSFSLLFSSTEEATLIVEDYKQAMLDANPGSTFFAENLQFIPQPQSSICVMDQATGEVKAIVGGRGEKSASLTLNRATRTLRQPGSTFKIVSTYAPALDAGGFTLASVQDDAPYFYSNGVEVHNWYSSGYRGLVNLRYGIEQSLNIVAVKTLTAITPQLGYDYLKQFGFTSLAEGTDNMNQALALGGIKKGVSNLELTASYAAIANNGTYIKPRFYTKILDHDGNVLIDNTPKETQVIKSTTSWLLTDAMVDVVQRGTGTRCRLSNMPVAGKTGTTSKYRDIWFAGYTPYYTCSVWGGYDDGTYLPDSGTYRNYNQGLWKAVMSRIHEDLESKEFPSNPDIVPIQICRKSGKIPLSGICSNDPRGNMVTTEYFAKDVVPTETCDCHVAVTLCADSEKIFNSSYCPITSKVTQVFIVRPADSIGTTSDTPYEYHSIEKCPIHTGYAANPEGGFLPDPNAPLPEDGDNNGDEGGQGEGETGDTDPGDTTPSPDDSLEGRSISTPPNGTISNYALGGTP